MAIELVTGPSNAGKTWSMAQLARDWLALHGSAGVALLDFAPELERDGRVLGGRLTRLLDPGGAWYGAIDAHAPRAESDSDEAALDLARRNAERAAALIEEAPSGPSAVFVNDATIPFQHPDADVERLFDYAAGARLVALNAFDGDELGAGPVSECEARALAQFRAWADTEARLPLDRSGFPAVEW